MELDLANKKNWNNSLRNSIVGHVLILLIAFFFKMSDDPKQDIDTQYAVTVSFQEIEFKTSTSSNSTQSMATEGAQRAMSDTPEKIESSKPSEVQLTAPSLPKPTPTPPTVRPNPTQPVISETTVEESVIQAVEQDMPVDDPEPEYIPPASTKPVPTNQPVILNPTLPTIADIIGDINDDPIEGKEEKNIPSKKKDTGSSDSSSKGSGSEDPSLKDGKADGTGRGDSGIGKGKDASGNDKDSGIGTGGKGEGEFDASGDGIFGRKVIFRDPSMVSLVAGKSGKIVFKVCISRYGIVSHLEIDQVNSTIKDKNTLRNALSSMQKYKYEPDPTAAREQCGSFTVIIDNFNGIRAKK